MRADSFWTMGRAAISRIARHFIIINPVIAPALVGGDQPALDQLHNRPGFDVQSVARFDCCHVLPAIARRAIIVNEQFFNLRDLAINNRDQVPSHVVIGAFAAAAQHVHNVPLHFWHCLEYLCLGSLRRPVAGIDHVVAGVFGFDSDAHRFGLSYTALLTENSIPRYTDNVNHYFALVG